MPVAANYTLLAVKGWADIEFNHVHYHLTSQMVLFGSFATELTILALSPDWQCNIIINPTSQMDETIYSCLQIEKEWHIMTVSFSPTTAFQFFSIFEM